MKSVRYSKSVTIVFLLLVFSFTIMSFLSPERSFSENENRVLAKFPQFSMKSLFEGKFTADYETYFTDQFFLRYRWIQLKTISENP